MSCLMSSLMHMVVFNLVKNLPTNSSLAFIGSCQTLFSWSWDHPGQTLIKSFFIYQLECNICMNSRMCQTKSEYVLYVLLSLYAPIVAHKFSYRCKGHHFCNCFWCHLWLMLDLKPSNYFSSTSHQGWYKHIYSPLCVSLCLACSCCFSSNIMVRVRVMWNLSLKFDTNVISVEVEICRDCFSSHLLYLSPVL